MKQFKSYAVQLVISGMTMKTVVPVAINEENPFTLRNIISMNIPIK